ncbi:hypothetical protein [Limimaricola pyoseonensis]|uniref:DUF1127 domain-containing protein n=1 Tax=Limimaricola pyoseonensis TaxID=521013 RepID=A0A1G7J2Y1_9RHOB|nr:hypothetical protein [Limimaricola pyoseonensis]SDF19233.1 hypothetical protein SAMN04488567_3623 [Limimaricola pyoseonensis]
MPAIAASPLALTTSFARLAAACGRWFAHRQSLCDLRQLSDADLAHLGIRRDTLHRVIARSTGLAPRPAAPARESQAARPLPGGAIGLLTSAALRR